VAACQVLAAEIWPFLPDLAAGVAAACHDFGGALPKPRPVFPRIERRDRLPVEPAPATRQYPAVAAGTERVSEVA
jgi:hypothetical protein